MADLAAMLRGRALGRWLHWGTALLTVAVAVATDPTTAQTLGAIYAVVGLAFVARAVLVRPLGRPGPKMGQGVRLAYLAVYRGLYAAVAAVVITGLASGMAGPGIAAAIGMESEAMARWHGHAFRAVFVLAAAHLVFSAWRGAALGEKPFEAMLPKM